MNLSHIQSLDPSYFRLLTGHDEIQYRAGLPSETEEAIVSSSTDPLVLITPETSPMDNMLAQFDQEVERTAEMLSGGSRRQPSPVTLFSPFHSDDEEDEEIPGPFGTVISRQTGMILGQPTPARIQHSTPIMFTDVYQSSVGTRIRLLNPLFQLIRITNQDETHLYAYKIGDRYYCTHDFFPIDLEGRSFIVLAWPPDVVLYSQPILIVSGHDYGIYHTNNGDLSSIVPLSLDSVITARYRLNFTVEIGGQVQRITDILPTFNGNIENDIVNCIAQGRPVSSLYTIHVPGDTQRHRPLDQEDDDITTGSQRVNNGYEAPLHFSPYRDRDEVDARSSLPSLFHSELSEDESDWYIPSSPNPKRARQTLLESKDQERTFITDNVVQTLLRQLYHIPVELPDRLPLVGIGIQGEVISFDRAKTLLEKDMVTKFSLDPYLQPWAGPPEGENRMITLTCKNGSTYLVKAQYIFETNQIFPPL